MSSLAKFYAEPEHLGNLFGAEGPFYGAGGHRGVDWILPQGTPIVSWCSGVVVWTGSYTKLGYGVIIRTDAGLYAGFWHMAKPTPLKLGQRVKAGLTVVGAVGSTGTSTTGPHLHATFEPTIAVGTGNALNPLPFIRRAVAAFKITKRKGSTVTAFYCTTTDKPSLPGDTQPVQAWAVGGDSPGTSANWFETTSAAHASALAAQHNAAGNKWVHLTRAEFAAMRSQYLEPLRLAFSPAEGITTPASVADEFARRMKE